jgi:signal transduction histidine kinase
MHVEENDIKFFESIYGDDKRYEQILLNFVSNALKFTNQGGNVDVYLEIKSLSPTIKSSGLQLSG